MDARILNRGATVMVLTSELALVRYARSILEPERQVRAGAPVGPNATVEIGLADVVVIDMEAVDEDALAKVRRAYPDSALIALSPGRREADCIAALEMDADYLSRPFSPADLAARVRVVELKRFAATGLPRFYRNGPLAFDLFSGKLSVGGRAVALAPSEIALLAYLAGRAGVVVTYDRLLEDARLAGSLGGRPALRSRVMRLRRKIEREPLRPEILLAEIGVGYRLAPPDISFRRPRDSLPDDPQ